MTTNSNNLLLDCTFRDGGYYCNWIYSDELVKDYLNLMALANVDIIEIGLRSPLKNKFYGPFAYCSDEFLNTLPLPKKATIGVMINAGEFIKSGQSDVPLLKKMFAKQSESKVSLVRIACHLHELAAINPMLEELHTLGYRIGVNLMQVGSKTKEELLQSLQAVKLLRHIEVLYFADSLGNMTPKMTLETIEIFKQAWKGPIGIHTHDNMGSALMNSMTAIENGVSWIDGTVLGMGRGAGNAKTEYLMLEMNKYNNDKYEPEVLFPLILDFQELQKKYGWGSSLMYYLSATYNIHPSFIQEVVSDPNASPYQIMDFVNNLKKTSSMSFNQQKLTTAMKGEYKDSVGDWAPTAEIKTDEILIIGSGDSVGEHKTALEAFIKRKKPTVLSLNINKFLSQDFVNFYVASHPTRLALDSGKYAKLEKPLIVPLNSFPDTITSKIKTLNIRSYGASIKDGQFKIAEKECVIPQPLALAYALAICGAANAKTIYLAGFDGYAGGDARNNEVEGILNLFKENKNCDLLSITPTAYENLKQTTVYSPLL